MPERGATVDVKRFALLRAVATAAGKMGVQWMVTGAGGRILLLEGVYGLPSGRATIDLDFAVMVESWEHFRRLEEAICAIPGYSADPRQKQRILYELGGHLDLIPFGGVEDEAGELRWPPDGEFVLNVAGFSDARTSSRTVLVNGELAVPVVSAEGLAMLKLFAWRDRHLTQPHRDAADIAYVLLNYADLLGEVALFEDHLPTVEAADYDLQLAAARVLGARIGAISSSSTRGRLLSLLQEALAADEDADLVRDLSVYLVPPDGERALALLQALHHGLKESAGVDEPPLAGAQHLRSY